VEKNKWKAFLLVPGDEVLRIPRISVHIHRVDNNYVAESLINDDFQSQVSDSSPFFAALIAYQDALEKE
jgi:hypothetical protein